MFEAITDFFDGMSDGQMWAGALVCALSAALAAFGFDRYQGWRRISWSEVYNGPINKHINSRQSPGMWEIHWQGRQISEGSLVILEVRNSGVQTLEPEHFAVPLHFTFHGRKVVHFKVRDTNASLEAALRPQPVSPARQSDTIGLPTFTLNRRERFRLLVLLEDDGAGAGVPVKPAVTSDGKLKGGRIKRTAGRARRRWATALVVTAVAACGVGAGVYANNRSLALEATCSRGTLEVAGSSAFSPLVHQVKEAYQDQCADADVVLRATDSADGLARLRASPTAERIAMVDTVAQEGIERPGLDAHRVGVLVYAVVAHRNLADRMDGDLWDEGLDQDRLARIFTGRAGHGTVAVIRSAGSGTREAFDRKVTGRQPAKGVPRCRDRVARVCSVGSTIELLDFVNRTPGAIGYAEAAALPFFPNVRTVPVNGTPPTKENVLSGDYGFWASEVLYTRENATGPTRNFLDFLRSRGVSRLLEGQGFLPCRELTGARDERMRCDAG